jgi:hypothetical protein
MWGSNKRSRRANWEYPHNRSLIEAVGDAKITQFDSDGGVMKSSTFRSTCACVYPGK